MSRGGDISDDRFGAAIVLVDRRGRVQGWNARAERTLGLRGGEALSSFYSPEEAAAGKPEALLARAAAEGHAADDGLLARGDGTRFWASIALSALFDATGLAGHAAIILELGDRCELSARHARRLQLLAEASRAFAVASLDVDAALAAVADRCADILGDLCAVMLLSEDGRSAHVRAVADRDPRVRAAMAAALSERPLDLDDGVLGAAVRTGRPQLVAPADPAEIAARAEPAVRELALRFGFGCLLAVPMFSGGKVIGVLTIARRQPGEPYDGDDTALLQDLADRAGLAISNARTYRAEVEARQRLVGAEMRATFLAEASKLLASSLDVEETLRTIARMMVPALGDDCTVHVVDDGAPHRLAEASADPRDEALLSELRALPSTAAVRRVIATGETLFIPELDQAALERLTDGDPHHQSVIRRLGLCSSLTVPLVGRGRVLGVIAFGVRDPSRAYQPDDIALAEELGRRAGMAVENGRLYREAREQRAKVLLARQRAEAARARADFLARASELLASSLDYDKTLEQVANLAVPRLADWAAVELVEADRRRQLVVAHADPAKVSQARELSRRYPPDPNAPHGVANVLRTGKAELYPTIDEEMLRAGTRDEEHLRAVHELGLHSAMIVPLVARGHVLGAITLVTAESGRSYDDTDLALAEELARRAAVAVDNARLYQEAHDAIRARDDFLSIASHELRTPLSSLVLQLAGFRRGAGELGARTVQRLDVVARQLQRLEALIDNLLDVSRVMAGRLALERSEVDLADVAREVAARLRDDADRAGCALRLELAPCTGSWDRLRLEQILSNLVANAIKYAPGEPIDITLAASAKEARLSVRDRGIGIAAADQARIFERFERAVSQRHFGGLGLGLWIARQIVEAHGGSIAVESAPGQGSLFTVALPRNRPERAAQAAAAPA